MVLCERMRDLMVKDVKGHQPGLGPSQRIIFFCYICGSIGAQGRRWLAKGWPTEH